MPLALEHRDEQHMETGLVKPSSTSCSQELSRAMSRCCLCAAAESITGLGF